MAAEGISISSESFTLPPRQPSALLRAAAVISIGGLITAAGVLGPDAFLDRKAEGRFQQAASAAASPVISTAQTQLKELASLAAGATEGSDGSAFQAALKQRAWSDGGVFGDVAVIEYLDETSLMSVGPQAVMNGDTRTVASASADPQIVVRAFAQTGQSATQIGPSLAQYLADLAITGKPSATDDVHLVWGPATSMLKAGVLTAADSAENQEVGRTVIAAAVPIPERGWVLALIEPVGDAPNGLARLVEIGDATVTKTIGGVGIEQTNRRSRSAVSEASLGPLHVRVAVLGSWRFATPQKTHPVPIGLALGGITLALACFVGQRQHRRNTNALRTMVATAQHQARTDALTGLANRIGLLEATQSVGPEECVAVILADLDRFKVVNDSRGHASGDQLLQAVARRLRAIGEAHPEVRCVARFGGDEFVLVLAGESEGLSAAAVDTADAILRGLRTPFPLGADTVVIGASIGLATGKADQAEQVVSDADIAMYAAKRAGGGQVAVADDDLRRAGSGQLDLEIGIRRALALGEFVPFFQPIVDRSGSLHSFEALIRWRREGQLVGPGAFLPAAAAAGLLAEVSTSMLAAVCPIVSEWNHARVAAGMAPVTVHVNCVEGQLMDFGFPDVVAALLEHHRVDPSWLMLEVSEETAIDRIARGTPTLQALRAMGVRFSLDDFGFGNTSLTMLRELGEVAELKLDKSIVDTITERGIGGDSDVVDAILGFARRRGITIVAEGIEQRAQWEALVELGVQLYQGFLFARPLPPEQAAMLALPSSSATAVSLLQPA